MCTRCARVHMICVQFRRAGPAWKTTHARSKLRHDRRAHPEKSVGEQGGVLKKEQPHATLRMKDVSGPHSPLSTNELNGLGPPPSQWSGLARRRRASEAKRAPEDAAWSSLAPRWTQKATPVAGVVCANHTKSRGARHGLVVSPSCAGARYGGSQRPCDCCASSHA